jgi:hypothetical protein
MAATGRAMDLPRGYGLLAAINIAPRAVLPPTMTEALPGGSGPLAAINIAPRTVLPPPMTEALPGGSGPLAAMSGGAIDHVRHRAENGASTRHRARTARRVAAATGRAMDLPGGSGLLAAINIAPRTVLPPPMTEALPGGSGPLAAMSGGAIDHLRHRAENGASTRHRARRARRVMAATGHPLDCALGPVNAAHSGFSFGFHIGSSPPSSRASVRAATNSRSDSRFR